MNRILPLVILVSLASCSSDLPAKPRIIQPNVYDSSQSSEVPQTSGIRAPWEIITDQDEDVEKLLSEKKIKDALGLLSERKKSDPTLNLYAEQASLYLKLGRAKEALTTVSEFVSLNQIGMEDVPPELALIAAYAYKSQKDIDQTFAWFGVTLRKSSSPRASQIARLEVKNLLSRISDKIFSTYFTKWEQDQSLSPLILEEQNRRNHGGSVIRIEETDYFSPVTYGYSDKELGKPASPTVAAQEEKSSDVALILPLKSNRIAEDQKKAFELAITDTNPPVTYQIISASNDQPVAPPKVVVNLGPKNIASSPITKGAVVISVNPRLAESETSIAPRLQEEISELVKISQEGSKCDQTFAVADDSITVPSSVKKISLDALLANASTEAVIAKPCLIGGFEIEDHADTIKKIKARWPGLRLFGRSSWVDPVLLQTYQSLFEGSVFITPFYLGSSRELVREFLSSFQNTAGTEGTYTAALAYDAARISSLILGKKQPESASYSLQSVTGIETFVVSTDKGSGTKRVSVSERRFTRLTLKEGDLEELSSY